ncbi:hypothetical protein [Paraburkholderia sp. JHI869]|uniref:hypothetical protein n=1 Tax=Paraburkholderia sp. JHI869 TaxID=3112959 RepID=UPI00318059F3
MVKARSLAGFFASVRVVRSCGRPGMVDAPGCTRVTLGSPEVWEEPMNTDESAYQRYSVELAEKLAMRDHFRSVMEGAAQAGWTLPVSLKEASEFLAALDGDVCILSMWIFAHDAQAAMRAADAPTLAQRAAAEIARRLSTPPQEGDDLKNWRVSFPCLHERQAPPLTRRQERDIEICNAVCESIERRAARGEKDGLRKAAVDEVAPRFHLEKRSIEKAYDENRQRVELMRQLARAVRSQE